MLAESFVEIWKCVTRTNICGPRTTASRRPLSASGGQHSRTAQQGIRIKRKINRPKTHKNKRYEKSRRNNREFD